MKLTPITKKEALALFEKIDEELFKISQKARVTVVGGLAIILQGHRDRVTLDIDIAPTADASLFIKICKKFQVPVDIVSISSTVDLVHAKKINQYRGKSLTVDSVGAEDLIKLKLERFYKQDPEDIFAIIDRTALPYEKFKTLVQEMLPDYIGNPRSVILSAQEVVERKYPNHLNDFEKTINST